MGLHLLLAIYMTTGLVELTGTGHEDIEAILAVLPKVPIRNRSQRPRLVLIEPEWTELPVSQWIRVWNQAVLRLVQIKPELGRRIPLAFHI